MKEKLFLISDIVEWTDNFKSWNVAFILRQIRHNLLIEFKKSCIDFALPFLENINQGSVCLLHIVDPNFDMEKCAKALQFAAIPYRSVYFWVSEGDTQSLYYFQQNSNIKIKLKLNEELIPVFRQICNEVDMPFPLLPDRLDQITHLTGHTHYDGEPYVNFASEPDKIIDLKNLINGLFKAELAFNDLEKLGIEDFKGWGNLVYQASTLWLNNIIKTDLVNNLYKYVEGVVVKPNSESLTQKGYDAVELLTDVFENLVKYYGPEYSSIRNIEYNLNQKLVDKCYLKKLDDPNLLRANQFFASLPADAKDIDLFVFCENKIHFADSKFRTITLVEADKQDLVPYQNLKKKFLEFLGDRLLIQDKAELETYRSLISLLPNDIDWKHSLGYFIGNLVEQMNPNAALPIDFLSRLTLYLPQQIENLGKIQASLGDFLTGVIDSRLDEETRLVLLEKVTQLSIRKGQIRSSLDVMQIYLLYQETLDVINEVLAQSDTIFFDLKFQWMVILADAKYTVFPSFLGLIHKTEAKLLVKPGTFYDPCFKQIQVLWDQLIDKSKYLLTFSSAEEAMVIDRALVQDKRLVHAEKLLKLPDREFKQQELGGVYQEILKIEERILFVDKASTICQNLIPFIEDPNNTPADIQREINTHLLYLQDYHQEAALLLQLAPKKKNWGLFNWQADNPNQELGRYKEELKTYFRVLQERLRKLKENENFDLKIYKSILADVRSPDTNKDWTFIVPYHREDALFDIDEERVIQELNLEGKSKIEVDLALASKYREKYHSVSEIDYNCRKFFSLFSGDEKFHIESTLKLNIEAFDASKYLLPGKLYLSLNNGLVTYQILQKPKTELTRIYLADLSQIENKSRRDCYIWNRKTRILSYIDSNGSIQKNISFDRVPSLKDKTKMVSSKRYLMAFITGLIVLNKRNFKTDYLDQDRNLFDDGKAVKPLQYIEINNEILNNTITKYTHHHRGLVAKGTISTHELSYTKLYLNKPASQLSATQKQRLYHEVLAKGFIEDPVRIQLLASYSIIQPYVLAANDYSDEVKNIDKYLCYRLAGSFLPESVNSIDYSALFSMARLRACIQRTRYESDKLRRNLQDKDAYYSNLILLQGEQYFALPNQKAPINHFVTKFPAKIMDEFMRHNGDGSHDYYWWQNLNLNRIEAPWDPARQQFLLKDTILSTALNDFKVLVDRHISDLNHSLQDALKGHRKKQDKYAPVRALIALDFKSLVQEYLPYLHQRTGLKTYYSAPFPELEQETGKPWEALKEARPVLFFKRILNLIWYINQIVEELEAMNQAEGQGVYVNHLIISYVYLYNDVLPLIKDILEDKNNKDTYIEIKKYLSGLYAQLMQETLVYEDIDACCLIGKNEIPDSYQDIDIGPYHKAYIMVEVYKTINKTRELPSGLIEIYTERVMITQLYYYDKSRKILKAFPQMTEQSINAFLKEFPVSPIPKLLTEEDLIKITQFTGHQHIPKANKPVQLPFLQNLVNAARIVPVRRDLDDPAHLDPRVLEIRKTSNRLVLGIEQLQKDLFVTWADYLPQSELRGYLERNLPANLGPLLLRAYWHINLIKQLVNDYEHFSATAYKEIESKIGDIRKVYFRDILIEIDRLEANTGLKLGIFSGKVQTVLDEFYAGFLAPLILDPKIRLANIFDEQPIEDRIKIVETRSAEGNEKLVAEQAFRDELTALVELQDNQNHLDFQNDFIKYLNALKQRLTGKDLYVCSLEEALTNRLHLKLTDVFVWDPAFSELYYLDKSGSVVKQRKANFEIDRIELKQNQSEVQEFILKKTNRLASKISAVTIDPNGPVLSLENIEQIKMGSYLKAYVKQGDRLYYLDKSDSKAILLKELALEVPLETFSCFEKYHAYELVLKENMPNPPELGKVYLGEDRSYLVCAEEESGIKIYRGKIPQGIKHINFNNLAAKLGNPDFKQVILKYTAKQRHSLENIPMILGYEKHPERFLHVMSLAEFKKKIKFEKNQQKLKIDQVKPSIYSNSYAICGDKLYYGSDLNENPVEVVLKNPQKFMDFYHFQKARAQRRPFLILSPEDIEKYITQNGGHTGERSDLNRLEKLSNFYPARLTDMTLKKVYLSYRELDTYFFKNSDFTLEAPDKYFDIHREDELIALMNSVDLAYEYYQFALNREPESRAKIEENFQKKLSDIWVEFKKLTEDLSYFSEGRIKNIQYFEKVYQEQIQYFKTLKGVPKEPILRHQYSIQFDREIQEASLRSSYNKEYRANLEKHLKTLKKDLFPEDANEAYYDDNFYQKILDALKEKQESFVKLKPIQEVLDDFQDYLEKARTHQLWEGWLFEDDDTLKAKQKVIDQLYICITSDKSKEEQQYEFAKAMNPENLKILQSHKVYDTFSWAFLSRLIFRLFYNLWCCANPYYLSYMRKSENINDYAEASKRLFFKPVDEPDESFDPKADAADEDEQDDVSVDDLDDDLEWDEEDDLEDESKSKPPSTV